MRLRCAPALLVATTLAVTAAAPALAGQVRVSVVNFAFTPRAVNCNLGDHVVWVWRSGTHTVTSGDSSGPTPDGRFNSGLLGSGSSFSWKSDASGHATYYCEPHAPGMAGRVIVGPGIAVSDFRITEVLFNDAGGLDLVEIANLGNATGDLGRYRMVVGATAVAIPRDTLSVGTGGRVVVHCNASGTSTQTDIFLPTLPALPEPGSVALYAPNTAPGHTALTDATQILDYVEWGAGGQANEATAASAGIWVAAQSINNVAAGHSIELCAAAPRNASAWAEIASPNFGSNGNCTTPARTITWGRIKTLYR